MNDRQIESLRHATEELTQVQVRNRRGFDTIGGTISIAALVFETSTDLEGETLYEFLTELTKAVDATARYYNDEEDD